MVKEVDFTFEEAVRTLGVTPARLERLIEERKLPVVRDGIRVLVPRHAILDYLSQVNAVSLKDRKK